MDDTTGVELVQGRSAGCARPMISVKREKQERAANFARVMREVTMLGAFVRLADYLFVEGESFSVSVFFSMRNASPAIRYTMFVFKI